MTKEKLADELRLTVQQLDKYERGSNRVGVRRLHDLSRVLNVPISFFYEAAARQVDTEGQSETHRAQRDTLELVRVFTSVEHPGLRQQILSLVRALAPRDRIGE
jgi:transcriptional regulator with XRE-family HTH domain